MGVGVAAENASEEWGAGREDDFVCLDLLIIAGEGDVKEVLVIPQFTEGKANVAFKVIPAKAELFCRHVELGFF